MKNPTTLILYAVAFLAGAAGMILEIAGSRILAPWLGSSLVVWTSIIGVILASLSCGYWIGGKIADYSPHTKTLALILFFAACFTVGIVFLKAPIATLMPSLGFRVAAIVSSFILFFPANFCLGMVLPFTIRLAMHDVAQCGRTAGKISAFSTIGSIVGTFLAGFVLIPWLGSTSILFVVSGMLITASLLCSRRAISMTPGIFFIGLSILGLSSNRIGSLSASAHEGVIADVDTRYGHIIVRDDIDFRSGRPIRALITDPHGSQSLIYRDDPNELAAPYLNAFSVADSLTKVEHALLIGGGAYTFPRSFLLHHPTATLDIVEIDPQLTDVARKYFYFKDDPRLTIINDDGRRFLQSMADEKKRYDVIYLDAFQAAATVPFHLTTQEMARTLFDHLDDDGVVVMNLISSVTGERGMFLRAQYKTYQSVFPHAYVLPLTNPPEPATVQNIELIAVKGSTVPSWRGYSILTGDEISTTDAPILTDDFAPVDFYTIKSGI